MTPKTSASDSKEQIETQDDELLAGYVSSEGAESEEAGDEQHHFRQ